MNIWIGGSPCSGKSTIAKRLSDDFDFDYYKCDDHLDRFLQLGVEMKKFQNAQYARRDWINSYLSSCRDINLAFTNWMKRDEIFAQKVLSDAQQMKHQYLVVDGNATIEDNYQFVVDALISKHI